MLSPVICAESQTEIKNDEPSGTFVLVDTATAVDTAPVVVNGKVRFQVVGVSAYPAERRAREISQRNEAFARETKFDTKIIRTEEAGA